MTTKPQRRPGTPRAIMAIRAHWSPIVAQGLITCRRCHQPIRPGQPWDLGHPADRPYATGNIADDLAPECRTCNRSGYQAPQPPTFSW